MSAHEIFLSTLADKTKIESIPFEKRCPVRNSHEMLSRTAARFPDRPAVTFQIKSGLADRAATLTWSQLLAEVGRAANLFRRMGVERGDCIALLMPNCNEMAIALLAGQAAGVVNPINPLLEPDQIAAILRESGARILVALAPFPKTDVAEKAAKACARAPNVEVILEVDLKRYLTPPLSWLIPFLRPKRFPCAARRLDFTPAIAAEPTELAFEMDAGPETAAAYFHTGGTTGMAKLARHNHRGIVYNGWVIAALILDETDVILNPLPLFHVLGAYPMMMSCIASGAHMVMPTPAGYRGEGVFDNFWKLVERYKCSFFCTVPTAVAALQQRPVNADVSSLRYAICGSAAMPPELFRQFEAVTNINILEGYGQTEATCLISVNPPFGERKIGSVGLPTPYTDVAILHIDTQGGRLKECEVDEIGEICLRGPQVFPGYRDVERNVGLFVDGEWLRTGDLGRIDEDGYIWITGRAKDLIIRGGHNIDPGMIEEALSRHPGVAFTGAIGQPDAYAGELPCAYVELKEGAHVTAEDLAAFAAVHVSEHAARPAVVEIMDELPKTAVGKIFKPGLRKSAIVRVYGEALRTAGIEAEITVADDRKLGMTAVVRPAGGAREKAAVAAVLDRFSRPWRLDGDG